MTFHKGSAFNGARACACMRARAREGARAACLGQRA